MDSKGVPGLDYSEWICNSTNCTELRLVRPQIGSTAEPTLYTTFKPAFTYLVFGEEEAIFGYKGLKIDFHYASGSLHCYLDISYLSQYEPASSSSDAIKADDIKGKLKALLGDDVVSNYDEFIRIVRQQNTKFRPIGEKVHEYTKETENGMEHFEIYKSSFSNEEFKRYHRRMQFLMLLYVEGSSYIEENDDKWEIYTLYKKEGSDDSALYHFVGYCTVYPFYCWPENTRTRISQFLILPPFQQQGHGNALYSTVYHICSLRSDNCGVTVEDPNEEFSDLRDKNDMRYLLKHNAFANITMPVRKEDIAEMQKQFKLTDRQTQRCIEMFLLSNINKKNENEYRQYRLQVKERLYLQNFDALKTLADDDRKEKLDATFNSVEEDYHRLLELI